MGRIFIDYAERGNVVFTAVILVTQSLNLVYKNLPIELRF